MMINLTPYSNKKSLSFVNSDILLGYLPAVGKMKITGHFLILFLL